MIPNQQQNQTEIRMITKQWNTIYPAYLDSNNSIEQGRRITKNKCVIKPTIQEMSEILKFLKVHHVVELDKSYSRNPMVKGRIKMLLKDQNGQLVHQQLGSKKQVLQQIGAMIPKLATRVQKEQAQMEEEVQSKKQKKKK